MSTALQSHGSEKSTSLTMPVAVILASSSKTRAGLLSSAGVQCTIEPPAVDEDSVKASMESDGANGRKIAEALAELKARKVSARHPDSLVIGADQVLECEGKLYDKPKSVADARTQLRALRGQSHHLLSAVVIARAGERIWHHAAQARLTMRPFSDEFLEDYLATVGDDVCLSVGAYQLEGRGVHLFVSIEGDYFTILGLPLLPVLDFLRSYGVLRS